MIRILIGAFLILHGLVHSGLAAAPIPNDPNSKTGAFFTDSTRSWLLSRLGLNAPAIRVAGLILVALTTFSYVAAGLGMLGVNGLDTLWRTMAVFWAGLSLTLLVMFWHPWLALGVLINIGLLVSLLWAHWPSSALMGS